MPNAQITQINRGEPLILSTAAQAAAPTKTTSPTYNMAPTAPAGLQTTGFAFFLTAPTTSPAVADTGGFTVTVWVRNPATGNYGALSPATGVDYGEAFGSFDLDASDLYFQISNVLTPGNVYLEVWEQ